MRWAQASHLHPPSLSQPFDQCCLHLHVALVMSVSDQIRLQVPRDDTEGPGMIVPARLSAQHQLPQESSQLLRNVFIERVNERFLSMEVVKLRDKSAHAASTLVAQLGNSHPGLAQGMRDER